MTKITTLTIVLIEQSEGVTAYFAEHPEVIAEGDNIAGAVINLATAYVFMKNDLNQQTS